MSDFIKCHMFMSAQGSKLRYLVLNSSEDPNFCPFWQIKCQRLSERVTYLPEPLGFDWKLMVIFFEGLVYHEMNWSYSGNYPRKSWKVFELFPLSLLNSFCETGLLISTTNLIFPSFLRSTKPQRLKRMSLYL